MAPGQGRCSFTYWLT